MNDPLYCGRNLQNRGIHVHQLLTPQQNKVLLLLNEGLLNKQIAYKLSITEATVKAHVSAILQKLKVNGRHEAVHNARRDGLFAECERVAVC